MQEDDQVHPVPDWEREETAPVPAHRATPVRDAASSARGRASQ